MTDPDEEANRAYCQANRVHYCEPNNPWSTSKSRGAIHPAARKVDKWRLRGLVWMKCPLCGHSWQQELLQ